jgi:hypothetical protein
MNEKAHSIETAPSALKQEKQALLYQVFYSTFDIVYYLSKSAPAIPA